MSHEPARRGGSFVVRIWWEAGDAAEAAGQWRGWIQHVRSGHQIYFASLRDLVEFIETEADIDPPKDRSIQGIV
ncbi:MAG: hypothetical protein V9G98_16975 [Candidatus Competibacter sp.]